MKFYFIKKKEIGLNYFSERDCQRGFTLITSLIILNYWWEQFKSATIMMFQNKKKNNNILPINENEKNLAIEKIMK